MAFGEINCFTPPHRLICIEEGSKDFKRDFVHVEDVIDSHLKFLSINKSGVFNIGSGVAKSFLDVANEITDVFEERN